MHSNRYGKLQLLVHTAIGIVVAVGAFAFVQHSTANGSAGSAGPVTHATVPGTQIGVLLPGETASVTLTLTNPHANVKAKLQPISAGDVVIDTVANPEANHPYKMIDAVKLKADTDFRCQGMAYHTTWFVHLKAIQ